MPGERGTIKAPASLRIIAGEADPEAVEEPASVADVVPVGAPAKPKVVTDSSELSAAWDAIVPELDRFGLVSPVDAMSLTLLCEHYVVTQRAFAELTTAGEVTYDDATHKRLAKHPAESVMRMHSGEFSKLAHAHGMTLMSRARMNPEAAAARVPVGGGGKAGESNPFAASGS